MGVDKLIRERRTVHSYTEDEVPNEVLHQALELAIMAPNHKLTFPFKFYFVGSETRQKIANLAFELKGQKEVIRNKFLKEGSLIFVAQKLSEDDYTRKEDYATMACAIQNFSLFMWEQGYGSKWSSGQIIRKEETYKALKVDPEEFEIVAMLWAGRFKTEPRMPERPGLNQFVEYTL